MAFNFTDIILLVIAGLNLVTAYLALRSKMDIHTIELATNSMKDALVAATGKASFLEGRAEGREEEENSNKTGGE